MKVWAFTNVYAVACFNGLCCVSFWRVESCDTVGDAGKNLNAMILNALGKKFSTAYAK